MTIKKIKSSKDDDKKKKKKRTTLLNKSSDDDKKKKKKRTTLLNKSSDDDKKKKKKRSTLVNKLSKSNDDKKKKKKKSTLVNKSSDDDKKKKKKQILSNKSSDDDKKKKKKQTTVELKNQYSYENDIMKKGICNRNKNVDFVDIDVSDRTIYWGLGVEHEMHLFHKSSNGMKNTNIMFNSQESTCFMTNERDSCCKGRPANKSCNDFTEEAKQNKKKDFGLTDEEKLFIQNTQWELSGRQVSNCKEGEKFTHIIKRVPILMPELITTNFSNRTIDSIWKELVSLEDHYIKIHMKNPHTKQKVKDYGALTTHLCGSHSEILIPKEPTINSKEYVFIKNKMVDYLGSYHITITLPHTKDILTKDFVKMHQNMAQQIQWLEPLFITSFFSPTQDSVGNKDEPEGSFRVMTIGWGNFAGSNIKKMGTTGLDRGSNIESSWRRGLKFKGTNQLNECAKNAKPQYKKSKSIHTGDFRTFGQELDIVKCNELYNPSDCINGRADGKPMAPPYGMEIRIFDHFPSEYFIDLFRIIILIGCNSQRHPAKDYVNRDKRWIFALRSIMRDGWNAMVESKFVTALRDNLGLPVNTSSLLAFDIFKQIVHELYEVNKDSYFNKIMNEHPEIEPVVPEINRMCWEMAFTQKFNIKIVNFLKTNFYSNQVLSLSEFTNLFKKSNILEFDTWKTKMNDLLYALETNNHVHLEIINGKIINVKILL